MKCASNSMPDGVSATSALRVNVPAILTPAEAAQVLTVSKRTMADLLSRGRLASKRVGRRRVILRTAIERFLGEGLQ